MVDPQLLLSDDFRDDNDVDTQAIPSMTVRLKEKDALLRTAQLKGRPWPRNQCCQKSSLVKDLRFLALITGGLPCYSISISTRTQRSVARSYPTLS